MVIDDRARGIRRDGPLSTRRRVREIHVASRRAQRQAAVRGRRAASEAHAGAGHRDVAARDVLAGRVQLARRRQLQIAGLRDGTVTVHTRTQQARRIQRTRRHADVMLRGERTGIRHVRAGVERHRLLSVGRTAILDPARSRYCNVPDRTDLARLHQAAVRRQRQAHRIGRDRPCIADPDAPFGPHQKNSITVHTAQLTHVNCNGRSRTIPLNTGRLERLVIDLIGPSDHVQIRRIDGCIGLYGSGNEVDLIHIRGGQARALHCDQATRHVEARQRAVRIQIRRASRQDCARGVDKAATIDHQPRRIRNNHLGALAGDLDITFQL
ncbi:Uncharacterised protein [Burkholderia pseudomallei]|nr:Uncharacterised protein [Burkholderia pseudomallei]